MSLHIYALEVYVSDVIAGLSYMLEGVIPTYATS
jgi:hypothetical protein